MDAVHATVPAPSPPPAPLRGVPAADHGAEWALVAPHRDRLVAVARARGLSLPDAQDAAHHVLCRAVERGGLDPARVEAYLVKAVVNRCHDLRDEEARRARLLARTCGDDRLAGPVDDAVCDRAQVRWLLGKLPERERAVVLLSAAGEPVVAIAAKTGLSYPTVDRLLSRARREMRRLAGVTGVVAAAVWRQRRLAVPPATTAAVAVAAVSGLVLHAPVPRLAEPRTRPTIGSELPERRARAAAPARAAHRPAVRPAPPAVPGTDDAAPIRLPRPRTPEAHLADVPVRARAGEEPLVTRVRECLRRGVSVEVGSRTGVVCGEEPKSHR